MLLDLADGETLDAGILRSLSENEPAVRAAFNTWVEEFVVHNKPYAGKGIWALRVICRNVDLTRILDDFLWLYTINSLLQQGLNPTEIRTDDTALADALRRLLASRGKQAKISVVGHKKTGASWVARAALTIYRLLSSWFWGGLYGRRSNWKPQGAITFVDTFVMTESIGENADIKDRYYPGMIDLLKTEEAKQIWFAPTFIRIHYPKQFRRIFKAMLNSSPNFLIRENFLRLRDFLEAFIFSLSPYRMVGEIPSFQGMDVSSLVQRDINLDMGSFSVAEFWLKRRLPQRLFEAGVQVRLVLDWHENQSIDRGLHLGFGKSYPDTPRVGYQALVLNRTYPGHQVTEFEREQGVLPHELAVVGQAYVEHRKVFCPDIPVIRAPALRFQDCFLPRRAFPDPNAVTLLVTLPITFDRCGEIIELICQALPLLEGVPYKIWIKVHPSVSVSLIKRRLPLARNSRFQFVSEDFTWCIERADILVTDESSTGLEAIVRGVPFLVVSSRRRAAVNPVGDDIPPDFLRICRTGEDVAAFVKEVEQQSPAQKTERIRRGEEIRSRYLEPVNREGILSLLRLPPDI